ncbi:YrdB family protein [Amycolatopsis sp. WQ 127309]|uniref:YrdB family protein n=1 Tax=Amycolatopsis sp. WQ 127309 TaxID=2932773 RepID=UPI001FF5C250|nr:YrdB family protein [Amycolatopsis sp. WQ 127309]UOZ09573.1 YrdB family protein [Amycolatopsis sp. WQ 127309]
MTSEPTPRLSGVAGVVLTVRFLTELALLGGLALAGTQLGGGVVLAIVDAVLLPVAAAAVWGLFIAPKASRRLPEPARFLVEFALFAATGVVLALVGWVIAGIVLAVVGIGVAALTRRVAKDG